MSANRTWARRSLPYGLGLRARELLGLLRAADANGEVLRGHLAEKCLDGQAAKLSCRRSNENIGNPSS
jgi:hypothetical protein